MQILRLPVKRVFFNGIKSGAKVWEYRLYNEYWRKRIEGKFFDNIIITLGYPKNGDDSRIIKRPWKGYFIRDIIHPVFGKDSVTVFSIRVN
jgi:hypothetical protein